MKKIWKIILWVGGFIGAILIFTFRKRKPPTKVYFEDKIELFRSHNRAALEDVKTSLINIRTIKIDHYFNERVIANLKFIESYVKKYTGNESLLLSDSTSSLDSTVSSVVSFSTSPSLFSLVMRVRRGWLGSGGVSNY